MITINVCGYNSNHKKPYDFHLPKGHKDHTLLLIKTESFFELEPNGDIIDMPPNTIMLYEANSYVHYGCKDPHYNDDWIHFELSDEDEDLLSRLSIPTNKPYVLPNMYSLTDYSRLIAAEKLSPSSYTYKKQTLDSLMRALLFSLASQTNTLLDENNSNKYFQPLNELRIKILNAPNQKWEINDLAEEVHMSPSHFQHLYKTFFGCSPHQDIINARIKSAKYFLRTTEISIYSLCQLCGYENEVHFMRQFKKMTGLTPSQYRNYNRVSDS